MISGDCSSTNLGELFQGMAYNGKEIENLSPILSWLSSRHDVITSIVGGNSLAMDKSSSSSAKSQFWIGGRAVSVLFMDEKGLKLALMDEKPEISSIPEKELQNRLSKFRELLLERKEDLCIAASISGRIPLWQVREYDQDTWKIQLEMSSNENCSQQGGLQKRFTLLADEEISSFHNLLPAILPCLTSDTKYAVGLLIEKGKSVAPALLAAYLIDMLNQSRIRKTPIDLFLLDESAKEILLAHGKTSASYDVHVLGNLETLQKLRTRIISGVFSPKSLGKCSQFIVDSSADIDTSVETISKSLWASGAKINGKVRSLLFVHEPVYKSLVEALSKKINSLIVNNDITLKSLDFVKRDDIFLKVESLKQEGIKIIPEKSDLTSPTILYDIGTSCSLISSPIKGLGHILAVIPYRNTAELFSLANNAAEGFESEVILFATNIAIVQEVGRKIKSSKLWVNSSGRNRLESVAPGRCALLTPPETKTCQSGTIGPEIAELILKRVDEAEKALKTWSSFTRRKRLELLGTLYRKMMVELESKSGEAKLGDLILRRLFLADEPEPEQNMNILQFRPFGVVGVSLLHPEDLTLSNFIPPILAALYRGNTAVVLHHGGPQVFPLVFIESLKSILPEGVLQICSLPSTTSQSGALQILGKRGKVPLLWVIHPGSKIGGGLGERSEEEGILASDIPQHSFCKVIVDTADTKFVSKRVCELDSEKVIYL